jgi:exopolysaccharide production protein ExoF
MPDEGAKTLSLSPQLAESDRSDAETFVATENMILRAKQGTRQEEEKETALRISAARNEVDALKHKLDQFDVQRDLRNDRLEAMEKLKDRGVETSNNVLVLRTELADVESRRLDTLAAVNEAQARLSELEGDSRKRSLDYTAELAKEMAGIDKDIGEARETMGSAKALASILYRPIKQSAQSPTYEILRQLNGVPKNIPATETSPLTPGDVLKVNYGSAGPN